MKKMLISSLSLSLVLCLLWAFTRDAKSSFKLTPETSVQELIQQLGGPGSNHPIDLGIDGASAEKGRALFTTGFANKPDGGTTSKQSAHFVCTSCHNIAIEDPDLRVSDPQARLEYVVEHDLPFLQGTTLYGAVNRTSFYNGDYEKKYGDLVAPARNNIREAIQLCAVECAQGRRLEAWEVESILAYLWTLELQVKDLPFSDQELQQLEKAVQKGNPANKLVDLIQSKYLQASPATFLTPPLDRNEGYPIAQPNPENGELIYQKSCLHCHEGKRYSSFHLDNSKFSMDFLEKHFSKYTRYSTYQVTRYGTSPIPGKKAYMPNYTQEKMNNQQLEDLRAYIEQRAAKN